MLPNYLDGDRVVVARMPAFVALPSRGDTVIARVNGEVVIKRVMAMPGDTISISEGALLIHGERTTDPVPLAFRAHDDMSEMTLREDEYFLMGDHRRVSIDSREFGPVRRTDILGRVILRVPVDS